MKIVLAGLLFIFLAAGVKTNAPAAETVSETDVQNFIRIFRIDLGSSLASGDKFIGMADLKDLEKVVGFKIASREGGSGDSLSFTVKINDKGPTPEIGIFKLPSQELARKYAIQLFLSIQGGRASRVNAVDVTQGQIGDLCLSPKNDASAQPGKKKGASDKTFLVFARNTVTVYVDSKRNNNPKIDVSKIARYIDDAVLFSE